MNMAVSSVMDTGKETEAVIIGKVAAGTTVTREMAAMMIADHMAGRPPALWLDIKAGVATTVALDAPMGLVVGTQEPAADR